MTLTKFSDHSLRLLIYLGLHEDRLVSVGEISRAYRVSPHILVKVVQLLVEQELITSVRGRNGGLRLNKPPTEINVGRLIRRTEPGWDLVECFDAARNTCPIDGVCGLKGALKRAQTVQDALKAKGATDAKYEIAAAGTDATVTPDKARRVEIAYVRP